MSKNRILEGKECIFLSSYYESGSSAYSKYNNLCQECLLTSTNCTKCDPQLFRTSKQGKCDCNSSYYDDGTLIFKCNSTKKLILEFHYNHQTSQIMNKILRLATIKTLDIQNQNQYFCQSGTTDQVISLCYSYDTRSLTCTNMTTQSLTCDATQLRILDGQQCRGKDGYYENNIKQCLQFDSNCLSCQLNATLPLAQVAIQYQTKYQTLQNAFAKMDIFQIQMINVNYAQIIVRNAQQSLQIAHHVKLIEFSSPIIVIVKMVYIMMLQVCRWCSAIINAQLAIILRLTVYHAFQIHKENFKDKSVCAINDFTILVL